MIDQSLIETQNFYEFRANFVFLDQNKEITLKWDKREFKNVIPIVAREEALRHYQNYIQVVLEGIKMRYSDDIQAKNSLIEYFNEVSDRKIEIEGKPISINNPLRCTIGVFFHQGNKSGRVSKEEWHEYYGIVDRLKDVSAWKNAKQPIFFIQNPYLIHGISYFNGTEIDLLSIAYNLKKEFECYRKNQFDYNNHKATFTLNYTDINKKVEFDILQTPNNFRLIETVSHDPENIPDDYVTDILPSPKESDKNITLIESINRGESRTLEFKPAIFFNYKTKKKENGFFCAKTICAFLNSEGGLLLIGVKNDKTIQGIDADFGLFDPKDPEDELKKRIDQMIENFFSPFVQDYLNTDFVPILGRTVLVITIFPSILPVFMKVKNEKGVIERFFIRRQASTQEIIDLKEFYDYALVRWFKNSL